MRFPLRHVARCSVPRRGHATAGSGDRGRRPPNLVAGGVPRKRMPPPPTPKRPSLFSDAHPRADDDDASGSDRASLLRYAALSPTPLTLRRLMLRDESEDDDGASEGGGGADGGAARRRERQRAAVGEAAAFLAEEFPVRCAERALAIESLPGWDGVAELREAHGRHVRAFDAVRGCAARLADAREDGGGGAGGAAVDAFASVVRDVLEEDGDVVPLMARAMHVLSERDPGRCGEAFVNEFLDEFLLNRVGSRVLLRQFLAHHGSASPGAEGEGRASRGIIDPEVDVGSVCRQAADDVGALCQHETGVRPTVRVETYSTDAALASRGDCDLTFSYIPEALSYVLRELLKNSCRATADLARAAPPELARRPIRVTACGDERRVVVTVADAAGGIPLEVGRRAFSYLYTTAAGRGGEGGGGGTALAGHGVGLPLSRLYARYLGGDLNIISLPGHGTHAYLFLPRLQSDQVEVVPDKDYEWNVGGSMAGDFVL